MDWCFGNAADDFLVPKEHEILNGHPPSESWLQWGKADYESMESLSKYIVPKKTPASEAHTGISCYLEEDSTSNGSEILLNGSLHQSTLTDGRPNYLLNDGVGADQGDDTFMNSFLDPAMQSLNETFGFSPEFQQDGSMLTDDTLFESIPDLQQVQGDLYGIKGSEYLHKYDLSPSTPSTSGNQKGCLPLESEATGEGSSVEECGLQELQGVMAQFTQKARICFRDSLYRLAKNSEQQRITRGNDVEVFNEQPSICQMPRPVVKKNAESATNAIDRAMANLMFNKMELQAQNLSPSLPHSTRQGN